MTRATPAPHPRAGRRRRTGPWGASERGRCPHPAAAGGGRARIRQGPARAQRSEHGRSWVGAQARGAAPTELAGWYFVIGPARIDCAMASKWRNRYCASAVSAALSPSRSPATVEYLGTELDWLQFFWGLTRGDDAWTPAQFLALQRAACAQRICSAVEWSPDCAPQRCVGSDGITFEAWGLYAELAEAGRPETVAVTAEQWNRLRERGNEYGVSTDLQP